MAVYTEIGYSVADIAALRAIAPSDRPAFAGALAYVVSTNQWFEFVPSGSSGGITPNSGSGRWYPLHREILIADRTYFLRTDGNDNNDGLANTSGGAFLTIAKFFSVLATLDKNGFNVTCKLADGTYAITQSILITSGVGDGTVIIEGNTTTPSNVIITSSTNGLSYFLKRDPSYTIIRGLRFQNTGSVSICYFINCELGVLGISNIDFGAATTGSLIDQNHLVCSANGVIYLLGNYTISGNAAIHFLVVTGGKIRDFYPINPAGSPITVTLSGTPNFFTFAFARGAGAMIDTFNTRIVYSGAATGIRYNASVNAVIFSFGGANYFPGNSAGTTETGGQYV